MTNALTSKCLTEGSNQKCVASPLRVACSCQSCIPFTQLVLTLKGFIGLKINVWLMVQEAKGDKGVNVFAT